MVSLNNKKNLSSQHFSSTISFNKAQECKNKKQWLEAIKYYQLAIEEQPSNWQAYHDIGDIWLNLESWQEAITAYQSAIKIHPNFPWSYYNLGESLLQVQDFEQALAAYQKAYKLGANLPAIERKLGYSLHQRAVKDQKTVQDFYLQLIKSQPDNIENYHKALEINPYDVQLHLELGNALASKGALHEAIVTYQMVLQLEPNQGEADYKLQELLRKTGQLPAKTENFNSQLSSLEQAKQALDTLNQIALDNFLLTGGEIDFPEVENPTISIILVLYNRAELTLSCLYSILRNHFKSLEVIIIDNNSTDKTRALLEQINGAKIILNDDNLHFLLSCNQASKLATGDYLLFLNNDAQILGNSLNAAVKTIESSPDIGAVGGKIILPDGTLQEAGSIIWQNGGCLGYGRGDSPTAPQYMFRRSVDFCSGAFLLTPRQLFLDMEGFDEDYKPAYYEETDYCVRLLRSGKKVIYDPNVVILHYEFASSSNSSSSDHAIALQRRNHKTFLDKHQDWFSHQYPPDLNNTLFARTARNNRQRILFIEDRIPHPYLGSGYTRGHKILDCLVKLDYFVTFYPSDLSHQEDWQDVYSDIDREVEVATGYGLPGLEKFLKARKGYYDIVFVSRPHNMEQLNRILAKEDLLAEAKIIYDAEALYCLREFEQKRLQGEQLSVDYMQSKINEELKLAQKSSHIISVSEAEKSKFLECGYPNVSVMGHALKANLTPNNFSERRDILFVGSIYELISPNADSIQWLAKEIFPLIQDKLGENINLIIAGNNTVEELNEQINNLGNPAIKMLGRVEDLTELYNQARLFVVPTRFAAGIPHKAHEAASRGLPMVTTSLIASQLGWQDGSDLLVADSPKEFAEQCCNIYQDEKLWQEIRNNSIERIKKECNPESFIFTLKEVIEKVNPRRAN